MRGSVHQSLLSLKKCFGCCGHLSASREPDLPLLSGSEARKLTARAMRSFKEEISEAS